jgi:DNA repair protein RecO (recombination protein O)
MPVVETESLVLKTYNLAEADRIVLLFSRDHGIVRGVAKGAKRLKSRFGSGLEPFTVVRATYFQKEVLELVSIQNVELIESYFTAASDPRFLEKFAYLVDILVGTVPPQDPNETLYRMVRASVQAASEDHSRLDSVALYFELWLLKLTGYLPQWSKCHICGNGFGPNETAGLGSSFELICGKCRRIASMTQVTSTQRSLVANALRLSPVDFSSTGADLNVIREISDVFKRILSQAIGRRVTEGSSITVGANTP